MPVPLMTPDVDIEEIVEEDKPWLVLLGNDPVNTMSFVVRVLKKVFGYSTEKANQLMLEAHQRDRTPVWVGERDQAEAYAAQLHTWQLWATVVQDT